MVLRLGLIGHPISHSLSPWIHNEFLQIANIQGEYKLYEGKPEELAKVIKHLREMEIDGFNVTVPYKQMIMDYIDELDPEAERLGAVNTVVNENGKWKGYSTDGEGYVRSIQRPFPQLLNRDTSILLLGAGGAARGIYRALMKESVKQVDIANRSIEKAESFLNMQLGNSQTSVLSYAEAEKQLMNYDLIIQTTSVGMKPAIDEQIISLENVKQDAVVSDIVYQPITTALHRDALTRGAKIHHGHAMLLYQAQLAFEKWTGIDIDAEHLVDKLEKQLRGE